jgi:transcriptional regulator with XRE-family HTH domain
MLRVSRGLDVEALARQFGVSCDEIRALEADSSEVSDELLEDYLRFFLVSYDSVWFGSEAEFERGLKLVD